MLPKNLFRRPKNQLEGYDRLRQEPSRTEPDEMVMSCPDCRNSMPTGVLLENKYVCARCGKHFRVGARQRIAMLADEGTFRETDGDMISVNRLDFPDYEEKLKNARISSSEKDGVLTGFAEIGGYECALFVMDPYFMMGSMGTVVGEKITRLIEAATEKKLPVVGYTVSGGARIQEGILSLMQMAKTSGAVKRHSDEGNLYIAVLTDPTTGGVTASFAMEADITLAEPGALIGFAGPRVIEQTIRQKLPEGFQTAEFQQAKGFVDAIVDRREQREMLARLMKLHGREIAHECI